MDRMTRCETPLQIIELDNISRFNNILDIGAGGEGLAARIGKERVYGVDIRIDEIRELQTKGVNCNWAVCDARKLCFRNDVFDLATIWFSLMYIKRVEDKVQVLNECKRALRKDGVLHLMDAQVDTDKGVFILNARFKLPDGQIVDTGYGVSGQQKQTFEWLQTHLIELGFKAVEQDVRKHWFRILCRK